MITAVLLILALVLQSHAANSQNATQECNSIFAKLPRGRPVKPSIADLPSAAGEDDFESVCLLLKAGVSANKKDL
jgi:hypothetical protein